MREFKNKWLLPFCSVVAGLRVLCLPSTRPDHFWSDCIVQMLWLSCSSQSNGPDWRRLVHPEVLSINNKKHNLSKKSNWESSGRNLPHASPWDSSGSPFLISFRSSLWDPSESWPSGSAEVYHSTGTSCQIAEFKFASDWAVKFSRHGQIYSSLIIENPVAHYFLIFHPYRYFGPTWNILCSYSDLPLWDQTHL